MPPFGTSVIEREVPAGGGANRQNARSVDMLALDAREISALLSLAPGAIPSPNGSRETTRGPRWRHGAGRVGSGRRSRARDRREPDVAREYVRPEDEQDDARAEQSWRREVGVEAAPAQIPGEECSRAMSPGRPAKRVPRARARPPSRRSRRAATSAKSRRTPHLSEPPHGHIVCRSCGRIHPLELVPADCDVLVEMTARGPTGWAVERVAYSIAAVCPKCRRAAAAA